MPREQFPVVEYSYDACWAHVVFAAGQCCLGTGVGGPQQAPGRRGPGRGAPAPGSGSSGSLQKAPRPAGSAGRARRPRESPVHLALEIRAV